MTTKKNARRMKLYNVRGFGSNLIDYLKSRKCAVFTALWVSDAGLTETKGKWL